MMSLMEMIARVRDETFTREQAQALLDDRVNEMVTVLHYEEPQARRLTLDNLYYNVAYYPKEIADRVFRLYGELPTGPGVMTGGPSHG